MGDKNTLIRVVAAVIERDGRFLLCQRPAHKRHGGLWEFPGGKLEPGENLSAAARRELAEELGVLVTDCGELLFSAGDPGSEFVIEFLGIFIEGEPRAIEHERLAWFTPSEMHGLDLAPSDRRFVEFMGSER